MGNHNNGMGWVWTILTVVLAAVLIYFVVEGVLFIGWAVGGVVGVILAICILLGVLNLGGFIGTLLGVLLLVWLIDVFI